MNSLMSVLQQTPKKALQCIEHILYDISEKTLHNIAAILAQKNQQPVETYGNAAGNWTWPVVEYFLHERGMRATQAASGRIWNLDSPSYLKQAPGFVGFIDKDTLDAWAYKQGAWLALDGPKTQKDVYNIFQSGNTVAVHKMWAPLLQFYEKEQAFHITTDDSNWTRYECQPSSLWRPEQVSYEKRDAAVKSFMRAHKKSPILMSNSQEMVIARPGSTGWKTEPILSYECLTIEDASQQVAETIAEKLVRHISTRTGWSAMAHALFSAYHFLGGTLKQDECSLLTDEERGILKKYENGMYKKTTKTINGK